MKRKNEMEKLPIFKWGLMGKQLEILPLTCCMILRKLLIFSMSQFPHL